MFGNLIIAFKLQVPSIIIIDIISNYYNDRLWSEGPLKGTFLNHNYNIAEGTLKGTIKVTFVCFVMQGHVAKSLSKRMVWLLCKVKSKGSW